ncbi:MAG: hypothetical protein AAF790_15760, partial [Planctomycetota bacterium]
EQPGGQPDALPGADSGDPPAAAGEDLGAAEPSPLAKVLASMAAARGKIRTGAGAREPQQQVITQLDEMIRQAEKQCKQCNNPSSSSRGGKKPQQSKRSQPKPGEQQANQPKPGQPKPGQAKPGQPKPGQQAGQQSQVRLGKAQGRVGEGRPASELMKEVWGRLPERLREQMLESSSGEFLPQYREEIERYFRRLAEEPAE